MFRSYHSAVNIGVLKTFANHTVLVHRARKLAQQYYLVYHEPIPTAQLVQRIASVMQEYTQSGYNEDLELEDAVHTAILTLKESFEGQMTEDNIEVGICNEAGFRRLTPTEVKDYLAAIA
ncbi:proteasome subunit alpha type-2 [Limosa lapponica baueri]|uniref:Proteasome subunit alpha type-2 n=1 Tax=Limosa lapponica baueri TaxID=1758121 RepID=A0A2I0UEH7_LIMLA|nr:proteasome subunit alpha type-2 [Limosa lapponica baueri]